MNIDKNNIKRVEWPRFDTESGKYILAVVRNVEDLSVGTYASDLGEYVEEYSYCDKLTCWADYKKLTDE